MGTEGKAKGTATTGREVVVTPKETFTKQEWVYVRDSVAADNKTKVDIFYPVVDGKVSEDNKKIFGKRKRAMTVGGVYEVEVSADGNKARTDSAVFSHMWHDRDAVNGWQLEQRARKLVLQAQRAEKEGREELKQALEPLRRIYMRTASSAKRLAMEMVILNYIRGSRILPGDEI